VKAFDADMRFCTKATFGFYRKCIRHFPGVLDRPPRRRSRPKK